MGGKNLLPYSVTPPKPRGPTEAERKIEEMTRQIEEEMEKREEEGEYFGKFFEISDTKTIFVFLIDGFDVISHLLILIKCK